MLVMLFHINQKTNVKSVSASVHYHTVRSNRHSLYRTCIIWKVLSQTSIPYSGNSPIRLLNEYYELSRNHLLTHYLLSWLMITQSETR